MVTPSGQRLTVLSKSLMGLPTSAATVNKVVGGVVTTTSGASGRPVMRVPPLNVTASQAQPSVGNGQSQQQHQQHSIRCGIVTRHAQKESEKAQTKERPKSEFHLVNISFKYALLALFRTIRFVSIEWTECVLVAAIGRGTEAKKADEAPSHWEHQ